MVLLSLGGLLHPLYFGGTAGCCSFLSLRTKDTVWHVQLVPPCPPLHHVVTTLCGSVVEVLLEVGTGLLPTNKLVVATEGKARGERGETWCSKGCQKDKSRPSKDWKGAGEHLGW